MSRLISLLIKFTKYQRMVIIHIMERALKFLSPIPQSLSIADKKLTLVKDIEQETSLDSVRT